jgi:hypothetical protein
MCLLVNKQKMKHSLGLLCRITALCYPIIGSHPLSPADREIAFFRRKTRFSTARC